MPREKSAGAVVFRRENKEIYYLLLHYVSGHWDFPKGNIEKGESEEETVRREIREETGIKEIKIIPGFKEWLKYFYKLPEARPRAKTLWVFKIVDFYLAETKTPHQNKFGAGQAKDVKISFEHRGYVWLPYKKALKRITYKNAKAILRKANEFLVSKKSI